MGVVNDGQGDASLLSGQDPAPNSDAARLRWDRDRPPTPPQGVSLLLFTNPKPVCQQLSSCHCHDHTIPGSYSYNTTSYPCSSKCSSRALLHRLPSAAPVFVPKKFSSELETKAKVIFTLPIELISGEIGTGDLRLGRMRVLAIEITRG